MSVATKSPRRTIAVPVVRHSVTLPASLAREVRRVANERHLTMSRALVALAEQGVRAESEEKHRLAITHQAFIQEQDSELKAEAGKDLIRAIFGSDAIAQDPIR